jgi:hypothetical protein
LRRRRRLALHVACATVAAALVCGGCTSPDSSSEEASELTDDEYVAHVASLIVALGEGLRGNAARERAAELGGGTYTRRQVETVAERLKLDPERWSALERRVDERIQELDRGRTGP